MNNDTETLAAELHATENPGARPGGVFSCSECRRTARIILASDWLAARVAAAEAAAAEHALAKVAVQMSGVGAHRDPCRLPDTPCLCGLCDFRAAARAAVESA